jgi:hypothetical protein
LQNGCIKYSFGLAGNTRTTAGGATYIDILCLPFAEAAVIGAGNMGAQIAAHLANVGIPSLLMDIAPTELLPEEQKRGLTLQSPEVRQPRDENTV